MTRPFFLFAPGAGAPSSHPWIQRWKERLRNLGDVETFDYAYMAQRRRPDPLPVLVATHREALRTARKDPTQPAILIGKSMGGRIGCPSLARRTSRWSCLPRLSALRRRRSAQVARQSPARITDADLVRARNARHSLPARAAGEGQTRDDSRKFSPCRRWRRSFVGGREETTRGRGRDPGRSRSTRAQRDRGIYRPTLRMLLSRVSVLIGR